MEISQNLMDGVKWVLVIYDKQVLDEYGTDMK